MRLKTGIIGVKETPRLIGSCRAVFVNGKKVDKVVVANMSEGFVEILKTDDSGAFVLTEDRSEVVRERIIGTVEVEMAASCEV